MYKVGDVVRLIPPSYIELSKAGLLQPECWKEPDLTPGQHTMLGGRYTVLEVSVNNGRNVYTLIEAGHGVTSNRDGEDFLVLDKDVENCPYQVGDKVLFRPKCSAIDVKDLTTLEAWNLQDPDTVHEVRGIINNYYIVIDYEVGHIHSHPLRWIDFEPA